jgi:hypothetical protein
LARHSDALGDDYFEVLKQSSWLESKKIEGGTASASVERQMDLARTTLRAVEKRVREERS